MRGEFAQGSAKNMVKWKETCNEESETETRKIMPEHWGVKERSW